MIKKEFNALIQKLPEMDAAFVELPFEAEKVFGKKRVKVKVWFDGILYRGTLMRMGMDCDWIGINKEIRKKTGKNPGETVHVIVEEDIEERTVDLPEDLSKLLSENKTESDFFSTLAYTNRKEYVTWIVGSRRPETRQRRLELIMEMLAQKKKNPSDRK